MNEYDLRPHERGLGPASGGLTKNFGIMQLWVLVPRLYLGLVQQPRANYFLVLSFHKM